MLTFLIQSSFPDRKHVLTIDPDYISFDDNALQPESPTMFTKALFGLFFLSYLIQMDPLFGSWKE